jgi:hypothetical protein
MFVWKVWPQTLHWRLPTPLFFSIETLTDFSWLQKRHWKVVGSFSFYGVVSNRCYLSEVADVVAMSDIPSWGLAACWRICACPVKMLVCACDQTPIAGTYHFVAITRVAGWGRWLSGSGLQLSCHDWCGEDKR